MAYQSFPYMGFGQGLNLRDKPDAVDPSEAIDALNVSFTERGAIQTRTGYAKIVNSAILGLGSFSTSAGIRRILTTNTVSSNQRLRAYGLTGGSPIADSGSLTAASTPFSFARFGTPSSERVYASNGTDVRYFDGATFTNPNSSSVVVPKGQSLVVQATDNRLVSTSFLGTTDGPAGATTSVSHVWFSDPGDPATWDANNFVQLTPGDGEKIMGAIAWRELVFVFKQTKFFVFFGNSVAGDGTPIFNYRPVEGGVGLASRFGIAATPNGVYFVGRDGLYVTTGSSPQKVSDSVEPIWSGGASEYYKGGVISDPTATSLTALESLVYMAFTTSGGRRTLIYDTNANWFSLYNFPARYIHAFDGAVWFGDTALYRHNQEYADDDGLDISARWRSGWLDFGSPDIKVLRASKFWGRGLVAVGVATDFEGAPGSSAQVYFSDPAEITQWNTSTWGGGSWYASADLSPKQRRRAERGTTFSIEVAGEAPWAVHRATHQIRQVRQPGIEDTKE
jgi:hypothetical protein